jgi:hypothetical protein
MAEQKILHETIIKAINKYNYGQIILINGRLYTNEGGMADNEAILGINWAQLRMDMDQLADQLGKDEGQRKQLRNLFSANLAIHKLKLMGIM